MICEPLSVIPPAACASCELPTELEPVKSARLLVVPLTDGDVNVHVEPVQFTAEFPVDVAIVKLLPVAVPPAIICVVVFIRFVGIVRVNLVVVVVMLNVVPDVEVAASLNPDPDGVPVETNMPLEFAQMSVLAKVVETFPTKVEVTLKICGAVHVTDDAAVTNPGLLKMNLSCPVEVVMSKAEEVTKVNVFPITLLMVVVATPVALLVTNPTSFVKNPRLLGIFSVQVELVQLMLNAPDAVVVARVKTLPVAVPPAVIWVVVLTRPTGKVSVQVLPVQFSLKVVPEVEVARVKLLPVAVPPETIAVVVVRMLVGIVSVQVVPVQFQLKMFPLVDVAIVMGLPRAVPPAVRADDVT